MIEIGFVIALAMAMGGFLKNEEWFPNKYIPFVIVIFAVAFNLLNAFLFNGDLLEAGKLALIEAAGAIGIHSGLKNSFQKRDEE
ncbi:hypothetical protein WJ0W_004072 [Paenibacillus melissococcoides]|uniref:Holin n=1 Tax=Paenibacillus melissococcoides TaxID=2912268 RepID=A0ABM9G4W1_9BACL|nr:MULTISPECIES: hypothetical protein [Paenibacillus]GIO81938.1 hypothetical protein J6TS7_55480 [Paenibacillus dendritiformis]CAH8246840.1 hypothetical protein WJ0W_004072 [Paenibacillus melissococcoides]CAH8715914.1 hypothetical protein HTL2_004442 [Paenibacillus melissococcoides]CAH8716869.1 hypothetical protein WDD9_004709 [Paenibacillus melissococcoides]